MKYPSKLYAQAFGELAAGDLNKTEETRLVKNFFEVIEKNNDTHQLKKIFEETEKILRVKTGRRSVTIETAREVANLKTKFGHFLIKTDVVEEKINPELLAGVKITVNDETQFDGSLKRKIDKLFS
ncbi:MAG: F0F1 ATP synthase subunit delta [Candidatus Liptonbacteria bacterium]|nr:F0F1 ATP synthase subunit delta [Candidatus Liptonbacteria bacterium]